MANKYLIHGATYCGDGTASNEAASAGAAGAWNDIAVFEGNAPAYGALVAGDVVKIRSKTGNGANSNITRTMAAAVSIGSSAATVGSPITWLLDNGVVWTGIDGLLTYTHSSTYTLTIRQNNIIKAMTRGALVISNLSTNQGAGTIMCANNGVLVNAKFDWVAKTGTGQCYAVAMGDGSVTENPIVNWGALGGSNSDITRGLFLAVGSGKSTVIAPDIYLNNPTVGIPIFGSAANTRGMLYVIGGTISGVGATTGQAVFAPNTGSGYFTRAQCVGLQFPRTMDVISPINSSASLISGISGFDVIGCDGGVGGHMEREWGWATSRTDSNPPTLQATQPDTLNTPWSWRVYPKNASLAYPMMLQSMKLFTDTDAIKTIAQELLIANTMAPNPWNIWLDVEYIDSTTGISKHISTRDPDSAALTPSTANWSASVWGAITLLKKKLVLTTPTAVKQNTPIVVTIWSTLASASANDILFIDPDFSVN